MKIQYPRSRVVAALAVAAITSMAASRSAVAQFVLPSFNPPSPFTNVGATTWRNLNLFTLAGVGVPQDGTYVGAVVTLNWNSVGGFTPLTSSSNAWSSEARMTFSSLAATANTNTTPAYPLGNVVYSGTSARTPTTGQASSAANTTLTFDIPFTNTYSVTGGVVPPLFLNYRQSFTPPTSQTVTWTGVSVTLTRANPAPATLATLGTAGGNSSNPLAANAVNWYRVDHTGGNLVLDTYGSNITGNDTVLGLFNSAGNVVTSNDSAVGDNTITNESPFSRIGQTNLAAGTYYAAVVGHSRTFGSNFSTLGTSTRTGTTRINVNSPFTPTAVAPTAPITFDPNTSNSTPLTPGSVVWFTHTHPGGPLTLNTFGSTLDNTNNTELAIYNDLGNIVAHNDNATATNLSRVAMTNAAAGTYYIAVTGNDSVFGNFYAASNRSTAAGTINLNTLRPPTTLASVATSPGISATNPLAPASVNWFQLNHGGGALTLDTYGNEVTGGDTVLGLYDALGTLVTSNDSNAADNLITNESPVSRISNTNLAAGTYFVAVTGHNAVFTSDYSVTTTSTRTGSTRLNINNPFTPTPTIPSTVGTVTLGSPGAATLTGGDTAWFTLNHPGGTLSLDTVGSAVIDTELAIYNSAGNLVSFNDNIGGTNTYSRAGLFSTTADTFYVAIGAQSSVFGNGFLVSNRSTTAGGLTLNVSIPAPPPGVVVPAANSSTFTGSVTGTEVDWFSLNWPGGNLTLDTIGTSFAPDNDTEIGLYDVFGNLIESDDDDGPDLLSLIARTNLAPGTYFIAVTGYNAAFGSTSFGVTTTGEHFGDYRLNVNFAVLPNGTWNDANGAWTDLAAWTGGFPVGAASVATFPDYGVLRIVTVPANVSVGTINFEGGNYLISGSGQIVMANGTARPEIYVFGGDPTINAPIRMPSTGMNFQIPGGSSLTVNRLVDTTLDLVSVVNVLAGGTLKLTGLAELGMLTVDPGGFVDFTTTGGAIFGLRTPTGTVATSTMYPQLVGRILEWYNNGARDGRGIGTSATNAVTTIGFIPNIDESGRVLFETYLGVTVFNDEFIMRATYLGDTNLDGVVNGVDLANLIESFSIGGKTGWYNGDFNYDGFINAADFALFNAGFTGQGAPLAGGPIPVGGAIPEPTSLALLAPAALALTRKRRTNR